MNLNQCTSADDLQFHVNLADDWERRYLAERIGVSEEALRASSHSDEPTVEEIFDVYCPLPAVDNLHARLHQRQVTADTVTES